MADVLELDVHLAAARRFLGVASATPLDHLRRHFRHSRPDTRTHNAWSDMRRSLNDALTIPVAIDRFAPSAFNGREVTPCGSFIRPWPRTPAASACFWRRRASRSRWFAVDLAKLEQKDDGYSAVNPFQTRAGARTRRRRGHHRIDRHLPLFRGAASRRRRCSGRRRASAPRSRCGSGWRSCNCCSPIAMAFRHTHPGDARDGVPADRRMGGGQAAPGRWWRWRGSTGAGVAALPRRRRFQRRRHHRADRARFHQARAHRHPRGDGRSARAGARRSRRRPSAKA